jgi:D-beta-D-heptose 7-phosphate kinase/D-beta-D-heptose 1-phosphate adenosyltransferase
MDFLEMPPPTILVIGDIVLDVNIYGSVNRIANEAPVPILVYKNETRKLGGCGNVLMNLQGIGCSRLFLVSMIGNDNHGKEVQDIISSYPEITPVFYTDNEYTTTVKTRGFSNKKIVLRYDIEKKTLLLKKHIDSCKERIRILLKETKLDSIILSDYNNGFLVEELTQYIIAEANKYSIPVYSSPCTTSLNSERQINVVSVVTDCRMRLASPNRTIFRVAKRPVYFPAHNPPNLLSAFLSCS